MIAIIAAITNEVERDAVEKIFDQYYPRMKALTKRILHKEQDAEDAAMNAISCICQHSERFVDYNSPKIISLIMICARNEALSIYRKNKCKNEHSVFMDEEENVLEQIPDSDMSVPDIIISQENCALIMRAVEQLDDKYKIPILLRYNHQMRNTEIADFLHIEANTVNGRLFRAKSIMIKKLSEMGYDI